jgi:DNA-binding XRE family transcriptional regulator
MPEILRDGMNRTGSMAKPAALIYTKSLRILPWDTGRYAMLESAAFANGCLTVRFRNGDTVSLAPDELVPWTGTGVDWPQVRLVEGMYLEAPKQDRIVEVPSNWIREASDPQYAAYWAWADQYSNRRNGEKIRQFREQAGLTIEQVAECAGLDPRTVQAVEEGTLSPGWKESDAVRQALDIPSEALDITPAEARQFEKDRLAWYRERFGEPLA